MTKRCENGVLMYVKTLLLFLYLSASALFAEPLPNTLNTSTSDVNSTSIEHHKTISHDVNTSENNVTNSELSLSGDTNLTKNSSLLSESISVVHEGVTYNCSKNDLISQEINGTKVYHCATLEEKQLLNNSDERGVAQTDRLKQAVIEKTEGEKRVVLIESTEGNESGKWKPLYYTRKAVDSVLPAKVYLSLRFAELYNNEEFIFTDQATRGGLFYYKVFENDFELSFQYEASVQFSNKGKIIGSDAQISADSSGFLLGTRLNYFSLQYNEATMVVGKYWGVYYDIAGMTDKYMVFGALGNGVYNAATDGGGSGTGRAADVLQLRIKKDVYNFGLQVQYHPKDLSILYSGNYAYSAGFSLFYKGLDNGIKLGLTGNYAVFDKGSDFNTSRLTGHGENDIALLAGLSYQKNKISIDVTIGASDNHITDNEGNGIAGIGSELYVRYRLEENWRFAFGYNFLFSDRRYYSGQYELKDYIASLQYAFNKEYTQLLYLEGKYSAGTNADGSEMKNAAALGFRYLFDY